MIRETLSIVHHLVFVALLLAAVSTPARADAVFQQFLQSLWPQAQQDGVSRATFDAAIRGLEPDRRGIYAGSVLYMDYADNLDSCIAIRTIVLREGQAMVQAGAGIVADSVPEHEYAETVNKARGMFRAIEMAERGL